MNKKYRDTKNLKKKIPVAEPTFIGNEKKYVNEALNSGWISSKGEFIKKFEESFAKYCGAKYACSCNNGTSALHLAVLSLGLKEGEEVIIPALTYVATANVVAYCKAKPILVDSEKKSWNMDPSKIEEKITRKTKGIIAVHLYGIPCDMDPIIKIAKKYNLWIVEDCAEAIGAKYHEKKVGTLGDIGCFSFFGNKIITTGEGGMCVTNNKNLEEKINQYKNQGMSKDRRYWHPIIGYNYRMTNIQAAIGLAQLEGIKKLLKKREENERNYRKELKGFRGIEFSPVLKETHPVYWMHTILVNGRDSVAEFLEENNIETRPMFLPLNSLPPYKESNIYPVAEYLSKRGINLPSSANLSLEEIIKICGFLKLKNGKNR